MANRYLVEALSDVERGQAIELVGAEAKHAATVARLRVGETTSVGNGAGLVVDATVTAVEPGRVQLRADHVARTERPAPRIVLAQALAKGDRDELAVQASTELGVDGVIPWQAARSVSRWTGAKLDKGAARWRAVVREAGKQSMRPWLPAVEHPLDTQGLAERAAGTLCLVLVPGAAASLPQTLRDAREHATTDEVLLVVGPEGGITREERDRLAAAGAREARLGAEVLRTSTAGPAAIAVLSALLGRW